MLAEGLKKRGRTYQEHVDCDLLALVLKIVYVRP